MERWILCALISPRCWQRSQPRRIEPHHEYRPHLRTSAGCLAAFHHGTQLSARRQARAWRTCRYTQCQHHAGPQSAQSSCRSRPRGIANWRRPSHLPLGDEVGLQDLYMLSGEKLHLALHGPRLPRLAETDATTATEYSADQIASLFQHIASASSNREDGCQRPTACSAAVRGGNINRLGRGLSMCAMAIWRGCAAGWPDIISAG